MHNGWGCPEVWVAGRGSSCELLNMLTWTRGSVRWHIWTPDIDLWGRDRGPALVKYYLQGGTYTTYSTA